MKNKRLLYVLIGIALIILSILIGFMIGYVEYKRNHIEVKDVYKADFDINIVYNV